MPASALAAPSGLCTRGWARHVAELTRFFCYDTGMSEPKEPMSEPKEPSATVALTRALLHLKMHRNALEQAVWAMRKNVEFVGVKDEAALAFGIRAATFALREFDEDRVFKATVSELVEPLLYPKPTPLAPV